MTLGKGSAKIKRALFGPQENDGSEEDEGGR